VFVRSNEGLDDTSVVLDHDGRPKYSTMADGDDTLAMAKHTLRLLEPIETRVIGKAFGEGRPLCLKPS